MHLKWLSFLFLFTEICALKILNNIEWTVHNSDGSVKVPARVPGGIYTDLLRANVIEDVLFRFNDVRTRWVANHTWIYEGKFNVTKEDLNHDVANLVMHGVDTIAYVEMNDDHAVDFTSNMFVRYVFDVKQYLKEGENCIKVTFESPMKAANARSQKHFTPPKCVPSLYNGECHVNQLRKMQASFAWDWGPAFPSVGMWKPVTFEFFNGAVIRSVSTRFSQSKEHWFLYITAYLDVDKNLKNWEGSINVDLTVEGQQNISFFRADEVAVVHGTVELETNLTISKNVVRAWWPNGFGDQPLYDLLVTVTSRGEVVSKSLKIGFRTIELVEEDASLKFGNTSAGKGLTFYFKVNGYPIFMKGSNWIPAHILPELGYEEETVTGILEAAKDSNMNMLRVWGGGVYESDLFYERCDQLGILIWQDFMFACSMYPVDTDFIKSVKKEVEHNVKRLQHHPSIALWAGNNENEAALRGNWYNTASNFTKYKNEYVGLYVNTIKYIVNYLDPSRRYLVSSPSNGIESENEGYVAQNPYDTHYGDTHYYNYYGDLWDINTYPLTRFASEYGFQSLPSLLTMKSATNESKDFSISSEYSKHRQHSPGGYDAIEWQIKKQLKLEKGNLTEEEYFKKFVFYSQIVQAMAIKIQTEYYRQNQANWYTMGALYWQLNDVWQAPTWSGLDFQRRWKMLQYFAVKFFAPVLVSPRLLSADAGVEVYVINDRFVPITNGEVQIDLFKWSSLVPVNTSILTTNVDPLSVQKELFQATYPYDKDEVFMRFSLKADGVTSSPYNYLFFRSLKSMKGLKKPNIKLTVKRTTCEPKNYRYQIHIKVDTVVLFLWLETPILHSYFEDNGIIVTEQEYKTNYVSTVDVDEKELENMITIQYYYETNLMSLRKKYKRKKN